MARHGCPLTWLSTEASSSGTKATAVSAIRWVGNMPLHTVPLLPIWFDQLGAAGQLAFWRLTGPAPVLHRTMKRSAGWRKVLSRSQPVEFAVQQGGAPRRTIGAGVMSERVSHDR